MGVLGRGSVVWFAIAENRFNEAAFVVCSPAARSSPALHSKPILQTCSLRFLLSLQSFLQRQRRLSIRYAIRTRLVLGSTNPTRYVDIFQSLDDRTLPLQILRQNMPF